MTELFPFIPSLGITTNEISCIYSKGWGGGGGVGSHVCCKGKSNGCEKVTLEYLIPSGRRLVDPLSKVSPCPPDAKLAP